MTTDQLIAEFEVFLLGMTASEVHEKKAPVQDGQEFFVLRIHT
jgi:hypothetical protein